jgi:hypothetical protein
LTASSEDAGVDAYLEDAETGTATGLNLWQGEGARPRDVIADMTEQVQDIAMEVRWRAWPRCPRHPGSHPMALGEEASRLVWLCPTSRDVVAPVGELPDG